MCPCEENRLSGFQTTKYSNLAEKPKKKIRRNPTKFLVFRRNFWFSDEIRRRLLTMILSNLLEQSHSPKIGLFSFGFPTEMENQMYI